MTNDIKSAGRIKSNGDTLSNVSATQAEWNDQPLWNVLAGMHGLEK